MLPAMLENVLSLRSIQKWADAHANLPSAARWIAKADVASVRATSGSSASTLPLLEGFLFSGSTIDRDTIQAYVETEYRAHGDTPMTLRIGEANAALAVSQKARGVGSSAFISACNPYSHEIGEKVNADRHLQLARELRQRSLTFIQGIGQHPSNQWPGEPSFLVFGLSLDAAAALGSQFEQNALVWCGRDAVPDLVLLR